mgnify:CR=1 FL=1
MSTIVLFEMNEVPLAILDHYAEARPASALAGLLREGRVYRTMSEDVGHLSPWATWPSVHRGVPNS